MRLLHTETLLLHEFFSRDDTPPYCILSHRWEEQEVTFQDLLAGRGPGMKGYYKIKGCCAQANLDGWAWAWVDSCCIDKTSSAELSEAINSMFLWYRESQVCYAYMSDVPAFEKGRKSASAVLLGRSKWFTRGWTLQELLAPEYVVFFDADWEEIGTKSSLADIISSRTGIRDLVRWEDACVAQKMSWASWRETTRVEDLAYCLLGIFGVYMPPLYGEGDNAFVRLQLEIINKSGDESIFAWLSSTGKRLKTGILAPSPANFRECSNVESASQGRLSVDYRDKPYTMTNIGLRLEDAVIQASLSQILTMNAGNFQVSGAAKINELLFDKKVLVSNVYLMPLNCGVPSLRDPRASLISIVLILERIYGNHFVVLRYEQQHFVHTPVQGKLQSIAFIRQAVSARIKKTMDLNLETVRLFPSTEVKLIRSFQCKSISMDGKQDVNYDQQCKATIMDGCVLVQEYGPSEMAYERDFSIMVENEKGRPGLCILPGQAWSRVTGGDRSTMDGDLKKLTNNAYRRGLDRFSLQLKGGQTVLASLKRIQGPTIFRLEIRIEDAETNSRSTSS